MRTADTRPDEDFSKIPDVSIVENSAELLYGLVHQRFILTKAGLQAMVRLLHSPAHVSCSLLGHTSARAVRRFPFPFHALLVNIASGGTRAEGRWGNAAALVDP